MHTIVNVVIPPLLDRYTYELSPELAESIDVGFQVEISLGRRKTTGFIVSKESTATLSSYPYNIKTVSTSRENYRSFSSSQLEFFQWIADYYCESLGTVIDVAVPPAVPAKFHRTVKLLNPDAQPRGALAQKIIAFLKHHTEPVDYSLLLRTFRGAGQAIKRLTREELLHIDEVELCEHYRNADAVPPWAQNEIHLNSYQTQALEHIVRAIEERSFKIFVLHGVTGSGKTEVYIEAIRAAQSRGLGAMTIVPEIALTPQLLDRFRARVEGHMAVLHSAIQPRARWDAWRALLENKLNLVLGARSAVFAPVHQPGILIVDEEHDSSYKQNDSLRYNARDAAIMRAKLEGCPVILGSATPSLETYCNALQKKYVYLSLPSRPGASKKPAITLVDLNRVKPWEMASKNISPPLQHLLGETLGRKEQAFILYNRRGFASYLQCSACQATVDCPNCSTTLTLHRSINALLCHYCGLSVTPSFFCQCCKKETLEERGAGTERVFDEILSLFPEARVTRLDRDAAMDVKDYRHILNQVRDRETDIVVGTQMIAKGHDLPGVTLVGIVDSDIGLHMPDFRAAERTFQLLLQAAGRAGRRDLRGEVVLQTRVPRHPSITATVAHDYAAFAKNELKIRELFGFPPFTRLVRIVTAASEKDSALQRIMAVAQVINHVVSRDNLPILLCGPAPAPLRRLKTLWRFNLLLKSASRTALNTVVRTIQAQKFPGRDIRCTIDVDPQDML